MKNNFIAVLDSGIGGISTLIELKKSLPNQSYIYFGDNINAPYGQKSNREIFSGLINGLVQIREYSPKFVVLACNTLSVNLRERIEDFFGVKTFGVFPPVESHLIDGEKTLLIATPRTIENFSNIKGLDKVALPYLAGEIERYKFRLNSLNVKAHLKNISPCYNTIILGCTHYFFVKNQIIDHLKPLNIDSGNHFLTKQLSREIKSSKISIKTSKNQAIFIGGNFAENKAFFDKVVNEL